MCIKMLCITLIDPGPWLRQHVQKGRSVISGRSAMSLRTSNKSCVLGFRRAPQLQSNSAAGPTQLIWAAYLAPQELQITVT